MERSKKIVRVSIYGIAVNFVLAGFKMAVGLIANSIALVLDAVNNLTDMLSSVVTIVGVKLSGKRPDKNHPFGYGRVEYFAAVVVAMIVLVAGGIALKESIEKIIHPEEADYSVAALIIIIATVVVKLVFGRYVKKKGEELNSGSLIASGVDALSDAVLSFSVFVGAVISFLWHISLEGYLGVVIAVMIVKTAIEIMRKSVDDMLGTRADATMVKQLKKRIGAYPEVLGVYDLALHNYGPNKIIASVHIQVDDDMKASEIHRLTRQIEVEVYQKMGIILTTGIYASNEVGEHAEIKRFIEKEVKKYKSIIQMHGFYVDDKYKIVSFDLIFDFAERGAEQKRDEILAACREKFPKYDFSVILDTDIAG